MSENKNADEKLEIVKNGKIHFGKDKVVCFACGEKIDSGTLICPYCHVELDKSL